MSDEKSKHPCFVDSNIWLYILLPGQDVNKGKTARELVELERPHIIISTQVVNEVINTVIRHASMDELEIQELVRRFMFATRFAPSQKLSNSMRPTFVRIIHCPTGTA